MNSELKLNAELRTEAREALKGKWSIAIVAAIIYLGISVATSFSQYLSLLFDVLVLFPLGYGFYVLSLDIYRRNEVKIGTLFEGFNSYKRIVLTMLLMGVYIVLWSLLLIIPGIIKALSYAMTPYILKDKPELACNEAIEESMAMMDGHKMKLFLLNLSFIGWAFLCILTFGIGFIFLVPYLSVANAAFYEDLKAHQPQNAISYENPTC